MLNVCPYPLARKRFIDVARNHMKVDVRDGLSTYSTYIPSDAVAIW